MTFYQGDPRYDVVVGHGPARCGACGCVLCAVTEAANRLAGRTLNPATANMLLQAVPGAFVDEDGTRPGDELVVPVAAPHLGLAAGPLMMGDDIVPHIVSAIAGGAALIRVRVDGGRVIEHHTILGIVNANGLFECTDSAWPKQAGVEPGYSVLGHDGCVDLLWDKSPRRYTAVAVRGLRKATQ